MMQIIIQAKHLISESGSTTEQGVHTDEPQPPSGALVKESHSLWDNEW